MHTICLVGRGLRIRRWAPFATRAGLTAVSLRRVELPDASAIDYVVEGKGAIVDAKKTARHYLPNEAGTMLPPP
jgi:hypothetical protein